VTGGQKIGGAMSDESGLTRADRAHDGTAHGDEVVPPVVPGSPDLRQIRAQARELRRGVHRGVPEHVRTLATHHPQGAALTADEDARRQVALPDAQLALARSYGFPGWQALTAHVGTAQVAQSDMHRWFGVELNNEVWDLLDSGVNATSPQADRDLALYGAFTSARHWGDAGTVANVARGEHLISRAAVAIGQNALALEHAERCLALVEAHPEDMADWDAPFAHEALARALAANGDLERARAHRRTAEDLTAALADEGDREVLDGELAREPWFGLADAR
jgi:hypothetical protein